MVVLQSPDWYPSEPHPLGMCLTKRKLGVTAPQPLAALAESTAPRVISSHGALYFVSWRAYCAVVRADALPPWLLALGLGKAVAIPGEGDDTPLELEAKQLLAELRHRAAKRSR